MRQGVMRFGLLGPPVLYQPDTTHGTQGAGVVGAAGAAGAAGAVRTEGATGVAGAAGATGGAGAGAAGAAGGVGVCGVVVRTIRSPKARALLAALLLESGRVVPVDTLKDALWGGEPPASAHASLHNHVARLRRLLDDPDRLRAVPPGYLLRVAPGELDVHVFERRVSAARAAHAARDWVTVTREATAALALWRGTPLSGLPSELGGYAFVQRLTEARLLVLEWRYDAELALGGARLGALVPELAELAAEHPLREAYHRQLMLALHRTDRRAEALAVHRDLRSRLLEELGVEPGAAVRDAHLEVLRGTTPRSEEPPRTVDCSGTYFVTHAAVADASRPAEDAGASGVLGAPGAPGAPEAREASEAVQAPQVSQVSDTPDTPEAPKAPHVPKASGPHAAAEASGGSGDSGGCIASPPVTPTTPRPAQLPPPPPHFTGRTALRDELRRTLLEPGAVAVVSGMAGVGKSALALHVAHALAERFSDGQLYVNLHGATPGMTPLTSAQALAALLRDLGTEPRRIPEHPDAAAALLRSLLAPTRTLLVLDDAATAAQVRPLLPAGPGCAVIVTSRSPLTALDGARRFPLAPLSGEDSAALLRAVSGRDGLDAAHPLVDLTGRLPLALRVVAARLAARRALTPDVLAGQLAATEGRLHHLEYDDLSVRRSLAVAHDALAASDREADRDAALALRRIGALDLPAYGAPLLARLTGTGERRAEAALDRLVDVALLEETAYGRYAPHDLVRDFARELAEADARQDRPATPPRTDTSLAPHSPAGTGSSPHSPAGTGFSPHPPAGTGSSPHSPAGTGSSPHPPAGTSPSPHPPADGSLSP
ncbi:BTAD domain-containing putative transcriptional regulator, partial [Streptomyces sp. NPDC052687]|uniref:BTAD domain-containing putative transcriptional regulator n=1 Tax=Streptomyces sp. NPDC052687 TaxID=3154759 RepID=UPI00342F8739